jgi:hypothetical protein
MREGKGAELAIPAPGRKEAGRSVRGVSGQLAQEPAMHYYTYAMATNEQA